MPCLTQGSCPLVFAPLQDWFVWQHHGLCSLCYILTFTTRFTSAEFQIHFSCSTTRETKCAELIDGTKLPNVLSCTPCSTLSNSEFLIQLVKPTLLLLSGKDTRILVCGGASANDAILQIISDIFNAPVYTKVRG
jgi:hypothetical protein